MSIHLSVAAGVGVMVFGTATLLPRQAASWACATTRLGAFPSLLPSSDERSWWPLRRQLHGLTRLAGAQRSHQSLLRHGASTGEQESGSGCSSAGIALPVMSCEQAAGRFLRIRVTHPLPV